MLVTIWHPLVYLLQKNVLTTSKPPVELSPAEVRYHRILKLRPNLSRLRSQSARVGGALGRPTSHPDDLFLDFTPKATRIERAAGRVPGSIPSSTAAQVLRMTRKQNEYFRRAPPMRTPPVHTLAPLPAVWAGVAQGRHVVQPRVGAPRQEGGQATEVHTAW